MKINNLLIKPAGPDCNLRCGYCFYLDKKEDLYPDKNRMNLSTAENMIKQFMDQKGPATFSWQGGEPTLRGLDFFRDVIKLQKKHGRWGQKVSNTIQTNGILLDESWARFFCQYNFLVGLSLDGPKDLHNEYRVCPDGSGTWEDVMNAANILEDNLVPFNILSVINDKTVKEPKRILDFFLSEGFDNLQFIPAIELIYEEETPRIAPFSPNPLEFGEFLDTIFEEWAKEFPPRFSVRYFDALIGMKLGRNTGFCKIEKTCGNYLVVEHNGDVYPCDFFVESDKKLGNLNEESLEDIEGKEKFVDFLKNKNEAPKECRECEFWEICHGGCQRYRGYPGGPEDRTYLCEGYRHFLSKNMEKIEEIAEKFRKSSAELV